MRSNASRMTAVVEFVTAHPGATMVAAVAHILETIDPDRETVAKPGKYKQAAAVVERVIKDRLVCQSPCLRLHPWNAQDKAYAEALERAMFCAPPHRYTQTAALAASAWRDAGDENRARMLERLANDRRAAHEAEQKNDRKDERKEGESRETRSP